LSIDATASDTSDSFLGSPSLASPSQPRSIPRSLSDTASSVTSG
jgi:hypothetical protein